MYVIKNALKCIGRAKARNVLIGIIVLVIAVSACLGLSIRQAAESAKEETLAQLTITASISVDRQSMMQNMKPPGDFGSGSGRSEGDGGRGSFDRDQFFDKMNQTSSLTLEEYQTYAQAESVQDFYYTLTTSLNGSDGFEPVSTEQEDETQDSTQATQTPGRGPSGNNPFGGGGMGNMFSMSDFQVVGYSDDSAMTAFVAGTSSISEGAVFEYNSEPECIISQELATFNELSVGDTVTVTNPKAEEETYTLTIVGIYTNTAGNESSFSMMGMNAGDPANQIYMSHEALQAIIDASEAAEEADTDEEDTSSTALSGTIAATYVFGDVESYEQFEDQARALGLSEDYSISSQDLQNYEASLTPLNTLSTMAGWFLLVVLVIGAVILVVLNIFNVRERKYEIGVLTAMGMKKLKVATQFLIEIFTVTMVAVIVGVVIGAVSALPVTNSLLESQIASQEAQVQQVENNFGRPNIGIGGGQNDFQMPGNMPGNMPQMPSGGGGFKDRIEDLGNRGVEYVTQINSAMNFTVVMQMLGIAVGLTVIAGAVSVLFVMRYEPLKILANRD